MSLKNINLWLPELRTRINGASDVLLTQQLQAAIREFAKTTAAYIVHITNQDTKEGKFRYYLTPQPEGDVFIIHNIWYDGRPLPFQMTPDKGTTIVNPATPAKVYLESRGVFQFIPTPNEDKTGIWDADVAVLPKNVDYVPSDWVDMWFDEIFDGTLYKLYSIPRRPWSSNTQAAFHGRRFRTGMSIVRDAVRKQYSTKDVGWAFPNWASA